MALPSFKGFLPLFGSALHRFFFSVTMASADFSLPSKVFFFRWSSFQTQSEISSGKSNHFPSMWSSDLRRTLLDFIGLCGHMPARPESAALYPLLVHRPGILPKASFRFRLTADTPAFG